MKFKSALEKEGKFGYKIRVTDEIAAKILKKFGKRFICSIKNHDTHSALQKAANFGYYISVNKDVFKKLKLSLMEELTVEIVKDESEFQAPMPLELLEVFEIDPEAKANFYALTMGKKRSLLFYINGGKQSQTRINRAVKIAEKLNMGMKSLQDLLRS